MTNCVIKPICEEHSGCLKEETACPYASKFGFSIHCEHPEHVRLAKESAASLGRPELNRRYRELRELRRRKFIADLGMPMQECVARVVEIIKKDAASETDHAGENPRDK